MNLSEQIGKRLYFAVQRGGRVAIKYSAVLTGVEGNHAMFDMKTTSVDFCDQKGWANRPNLFNCALVTERFVLDPSDL